MEILPGFHLVDDLIFSGPLGSMPVNVGLLVEGPAITMVDAGPLGTEDVILDYVRKIGYTPTGVKRILITHNHHDHIGALADLVNNTGAEVWVHKNDAGIIDGSVPPPPMNLPEERIRASLPDATPEQIAALRNKYKEYAASIRPVKVDLRLSGDEELAILGGCRIIHTPGHTPGHICLYLPERSLFIAGDLLRYEQGQLIGPIPNFTRDLQQANTSLRQVAQLSFDHMYGYHGSYLAGNAAEMVRSLVP